MDIDDLTERLADVALFSDFDGVLSEIVPEPGAAAPVDNAVETISALALVTDTTALVSGRPLDFLERFFVDPAVQLIGLYGLERRIDGERIEHPSTAEWNHQIDVALSRADMLPLGVEVEPKSGISLTVHYRQAPDAERIVEAWARETAMVTDLDMRRAKQSFELHPIVDMDKGMAVRELAGSAPVVVYAGDDVGDVTAFDTLAALADEGRTTLRILVEGHETPDLLRDRTDLAVSSAKDFVARLSQLVS